MDDLIAYVITLLMEDAAIQAMWPPGKPVLCSAERGDTNQVYPSFIIDGSQGKAFPTGDLGDDLLTGSLTVVTIDKDTDGYPSGQIVKLLNERAAAVISGSKVLNLPGVVSKAMPSIAGPPKWAVDVCRTVSPSGPGSDRDPLVNVYSTTFKVMMHRTET